MGLLQEVYDKMTEKLPKLGRYHKCLFHLHTPASHDYATLEKYRDSNKEITVEELRELCIERELFTEQNIASQTTATLAKNIGLYSNEETMLKYLLIAWELLVNKIELVVISDHNVISGYKPLKMAIGTIKSNYKVALKENGYIIPQLLLGIEVSCADKNHVVGIFQEEFYDDVNKFIDEYIMSPKDGTYLTSRGVIEEFSRFGGIAYIAHINSSNMFDKEKFLSGTYVASLLNMSELKAIGFKTKLDNETVKKQIKYRTSKEFACFIDADCHSIDTIKDRHFYIKGQKCDYSMIEEAIRDKDISISFDLPTNPKCYIKGIYVDNSSGKGFLTGNAQKKEANFFVPMSPSLNCLIGGRGTGKSTVLNIIEAALGQNFIEKNVFNSVFAYRMIWILVRYNDEEYLVKFSPITTAYNTETPYEDLFYYAHDNNIRLSSSDFKKNLSLIRPLLYKKCLQLFKVVDGRVEADSKVSIRKISEFYDRVYSVNELVKTASSEEINEYICNIIEKNPEINSRRRNFKDINALKTFLNDFDNKVATRQKEVAEKINKFNKSDGAKDKVQITYSISDNKFGIFNFDSMLSNYKTIPYKNEKYIDNTTLSLDGLIGFLNSLYRNNGAVKFAAIILNKSLEASEFADVKHFATDLQDGMVDNSIKELDEENCKNVLRNVNQYLIKNALGYFFEAFSDNYIKKIERFSLAFNVMNKEGVSTKTLYRDIRQLSLGQKVVAMLSFVLGYSELMRDCRPLVIDQPEDNLDNQYVFKNLVDDLRRIRGKRQVIIATHSATIVTNAKAEQVVVMKSDGAHGWVEATGYVTNEKIKKHIINYMEGGIESFKHKMEVYKDVLN